MAGTISNTFLYTQLAIHGYICTVAECTIKHDIIRILVTD